MEKIGLKLIKYKAKEGEKHEDVKEVFNLQETFADIKRAVEEEIAEGNIPEDKKQAILVDEMKILNFIHDHPERFDLAYVSYSENYIVPAIPILNNFPTPMPYYYNMDDVKVVFRTIKYKNVIFVFNDESEEWEYDDESEENALPALGMIIKNLIDLNRKVDWLIKKKKYNG